MGRGARLLYGLMLYGLWAFVVVGAASCGLFLKQGYFDGIIMMPRSPGGGVPLQLAHWQPARAARSACALAVPRSAAQRRDSRMGTMQVARSAFTRSPSPGCLSPASITRRSVHAKYPPHSHPFHR